MSDSPAKDFKCIFRQLDTSPKDDWVVTLSGDDLELTCKRTKQLITINRREQTYAMEFPMLSRADVVVTSSSGQRWLFSSDLEDTQGIERWWKWPRNQGKDDVMPIVVAKDDPGEKSSDHEEKASLASKTDEELYEIALSEVESDERRRGLWAKALSDSEGNEKKADALYIRYRHKQLEEQQDGLADAKLEEYSHFNCPLQVP